MNATGPSDRGKSRRGDPRNLGEPEIAALRDRARRLLAEFNATDDAEAARRTGLLHKLFGSSNGVVVRPPLDVHFGINIHFDEACFVNENCTIHDAAPVRIGAFTQISPGVRILTAEPLEKSTAAAPPRPVVIGRNVWVGAGAVIRPGVVVGDDAIVGAGSVVSDDVAEGATVAGNPARAVG